MPFRLNLSSINCIFTLELGKMNIAVLSRNPALYSTQSLVQAARRKHHYVRVIDYVNCDIVLDSDSPKILYNGYQLENIDAVIPRIGAGYTSYGSAMIRQFMAAGVYSTLSPHALNAARNKIECLQILASAGLMVPRSLISNNSLFFEDLLSNLDDERAVIKLVNGTHGLGVVLAHDRKQAASIMEAFSKSKSKVFVQEFIEEAGGADVRVFVVDGNIEGVMKRQAKEGEFRSNMHRGASATVIKLTDEEKSVALKAADILGLKIAGVDMLQSKKGPMILEVNASPGLEGIETTTRNDIAGKIIDMIERDTRK